jgi:electron transfer flavoprotein alpha subunit
MSILVIAEHDNANLKPATLNTVAAAKELNGEVHLLISGNSCQSVADEASGVEGISKILISDNAAYENHLAESTANLIKSVAGNYSHILAAATTFGKNVLPRLSALLDVQQISEITEVDSLAAYIQPNCPHVHRSSQWSPE